MAVLSDHRYRMTEADRAGFAARSPEGHAARSMHIKGQEEIWVEIQVATFCNWLNEILKSSGYLKTHGRINDLETSLKDGTALIALVESLQKRKLRHNSKPANQHLELENISIALDAIKEDGIKLVNIGNTDIHNCNVKLILALIWCLIAHYQLGASNFPPKKLMLAWLKAVLPECDLKNFTSDWSNGIYLSALINFCHPDILPNWKHLDPSQGLENCRNAVALAEKHLKIPPILDPAYLASPHMDELSGMTYLSYFMKEFDSPGYQTTLDWVRQQIPKESINNFRADWNNGMAAAALVKSKGGSIPGYYSMNKSQENWVSNLEVALEGGAKLGIVPYLDARNMANPAVEYLGVMAWVSQFKWIPDRSGPGERMEIKCSTDKITMGEEVEFKVDILNEEEINLKDVTAEVIGPSGPLRLDWDLTNQGGRGFFQMHEVGMHELRIKNEGEMVKGAPHYLRSMPSSKKDYDGIEPCAVGSTVEVLISPHHAAQPDLLEVTAYSPSLQPLGCPISETNGTFYASFKPDKAGEWRINVTYEDEDVEKSPFKCMIFDPRAITIPDKDAARRAKPGDPFTFTVDASKTGWGEVAIDLVFENKSIKKTLFVEETRPRIYEVTFTPEARGKHRVYVYLHGMEVKGSPFSLKIGKDIKEPRMPSSEIFKIDKQSSRYQKLDQSYSEHKNYKTSLERNIPIKTPVVPPRTKKKPQKSEISLFCSDHQTEEGIDLLPVDKKIEFDCSDEGRHINDISVEIQDYRGKICKTNLRSNPGQNTFTCDFKASTIGEHSIKVFICKEQINTNSKFFTFDASKILVHDVPSHGILGTPVEFSVDKNGAGLGDLEVLVNGRKSSVHMSRGQNTKKNNDEDGDEVNVSFIPHNNGRHRIDINFNGEKVQNSPWFVEVKDHNTPLMSPGLVSGKVQVPVTSNGYDETDTFSYEKQALNKDNFNKLKSSDYSSHQFRSSVESSVKTKDLGEFRDLATPKLLSSSKSEKQDDGDLRGSTMPRMTKRSTESHHRYTNTLREENTAPSPSSKMYSTTLSKSVNLSPGGYSIEDVKLSSSNSPGRHASSSLSNNLASPVLTPRHISRKATPEEVSTKYTEQTSFTKSTFLSENTSSSLSKSTSTLERIKKISPGPEIHKKPDLSVCRFDSESVQQCKAGKMVKFILRAKGHEKEEITVEIKSPEMKRDVRAKINETSVGVFEIEFDTKEVGNYFIDVSIGGVLLRGCPLTVKAYDAGLIKVTDIKDGKVDELSTFKVDASLAGEGQLEISINDGDVPNAVQVLGGGKCLVSFTPEQAQIHEIEVLFNNEPVKGSPFLCRVAQGSGYSGSGPFKNGTVDAGYHSKVSIDLGNLALVPVNISSNFTINVADGEDAELAVSVQGPTEDIPVKITGNVASGFIAEFTPIEVGLHVILVEYNGIAVGGTPFYSKAYDADSVSVSEIPKSAAGKTVTFAVDASDAGEGSLELVVTTSGDGSSIPTTVEPSGNAIFIVSFTPKLTIDHIVEITFNKRHVPGSPFTSKSDSNEISHVIPRIIERSSFVSSTVQTSKNIENSRGDKNVSTLDARRGLSFNISPVDGTNKGSNR